MGFVTLILIAMYILTGAWLLFRRYRRSLLRSGPFEDDATSLANLRPKDDVDSVLADLDDYGWIERDGVLGDWSRPV